MPELTPAQKQKLQEELTKYATEGATDDELRAFKNTLVSQYEQQNASVKKKEEPVSLGAAGVKASANGTKNTSPSKSLLALGSGLADGGSDNLISSPFGSLLESDEVENENKDIVVPLPGGEHSATLNKGDVKSKDGFLHVPREMSVGIKKGKTVAPDLYSRLQDIPEIKNLSASDKELILNTLDFNYDILGGGMNGETLDGKLTFKGKRVLGYKEMSQALKKAYDKAEDIADEAYGVTNNQSQSEGGIDTDAMTAYLQGLKSPAEVAANSAPPKAIVQTKFKKSNELDPSIANFTPEEITARKQAEVKRKIDDVSEKMYNGSVTKDDLQSLWGTPEGQPIVDSYLKVYGDGEGEKSGELTFDTAIKNGNFENRPVAVTKIDEGVKQSDNIIAQLAGSTINLSSSKLVNRTDRFLTEENVDEELKLPNVDVNNPDQIAELIRNISNSKVFLDASGKDVMGSKNDILSALQYKLDNIKRVEKIPQEIEELDTPIYTAIDNVESDYAGITLAPGERQSNTDERKVAAFKRGLNYLRSTDIATYSNVVRALKDKAEVSPSDYQTILGKGQSLENLNIFVGAAKNKELIGAETNFNLETRSSKVAKTSGVLGETAKKLGFSNKGEFSDSEIDLLVNKTDWAALGMQKPTEKEVDLIKAKEDQWFYDQIPKTGFKSAIDRGFMQPFLAIARTIEDKTSGSYSADYLRSKQLDRPTSGAQLTPDEKGQYGERLASDRGNLWYTILEGGAAFLPQILLTKGFGAPVSGLAASAVSTVPRAALTAEQLFTINTAAGTLFSSYFQGFGDSYERGLQKTGDPAKAEAMGNIGGTIDGFMEQWLPEARIGRNILRNIKGDVTEKIAAIIKSGGDPADVIKATQGILKPFVAEYINVTKQEMSEEGAGVLLKQLAETIVSPKTAADNDVLHELGQTLWSTALQTFIPAIGSGAAASKNRFTKKVFNEAAIKYDYSADVLKKSLLKGTIGQDEYNKSISLLSTHRNSIISAPKDDEKGNFIPREKRNEYAYETTRIKINQEKAATQEGVQKELTEKKIKESEDIQRAILMPGEVKQPIVEQQEPEVTDVVADVPVKSLFDRVQESGNEGVQKTYNSPEMVVELQGQALSTPANINDKLTGNEELTTDLIAENKVEDIQASLTEWTGKMKAAEDGSLEFEEAENHVALLETGLEKAKEKSEASPPSGSADVEELSDFAKDRKEVSDLFELDWSEMPEDQIKSMHDKDDVVLEKGKVIFDKYATKEERNKFEKLGKRTISEKLKKDKYSALQRQHNYREDVLDRITSGIKEKPTPQSTKQSKPSISSVENKKSDKEYTEIEKLRTRADMNTVTANLLPPEKMPEKKRLWDSAKRDREEADKLELAESESQASGSVGGGDVALGSVDGKKADIEVSKEQAREKLKEKYGVYLGGEFENHHSISYNNKTQRWEIISQSAKRNESKGYREFENKTIKRSEAKNREDAVKELEAYAKEKGLTIYDGSHSLDTEATAFTKENREKFDAELKAVEDAVVEPAKLQPKEVSKEPMADNELQQIVGRDVFKQIQRSEEQLGEGVVDRNRMIETAQKIQEVDKKDKLLPEHIFEALQYETGFPDNWQDLRNAIKKGGIDINSEAVQRQIEVGVKLPKDIVEEFKKSERYKKANPELVATVESLLGKEQTPSLQQDPSIKEGASKGKVGEEQVEKDAIEKWLKDSDYSDYISFDWDGTTLEIFKSRDEAVIELSRQELEAEGVVQPKKITNETANTEGSQEDKQGDQQGQATQPDQGAATETVKKTETAFSKRLREIADKVEKDGLRAALPDWAKADLPDGTEIKGFGGKGLDKVMAKAMRIVADAVDTGAEIAEAIKQGYAIVKDYYDKNTKKYDEKKVKRDFEVNMKGMFDASKQNEKENEESDDDGDKPKMNYNFFKNKDLAKTGIDLRFLSAETLEEGTGQAVTQPFDYDKKTLDTMLEVGQEWIAEAKRLFKETPTAYAERLFKDLKAKRSDLPVQTVGLVSLLNSIDIDLRYKDLSYGDREKLTSLRRGIELEIAKAARKGSLTLNAMRLIHKLYRGEYKFTEAMTSIVTEDVQKQADEVVTKMKKEDTEVSETVRAQKRKQKEPPEPKPPKPPKEKKEKKTEFFKKAMGKTSDDNISKLKQQIREISNKINCGKKK